MGKSQKKTGKGRLDKYYKLAKEQGYRARSAFKLIQLNKKYSFLESAKCCIDLCAAPGGWLQVVAKYMPVNSIIVGVDLVPIKAIPRVSTFVADITTPHCRSLLRNELKDWKADIVLHDGAPNVGSAWVQDAYSQAELVLMSLKLAVEFLIKGGTFVTKVFRSADYNNLLWILNQLFRHVEATKPPSSRNVSAEIFVVCRDFIAPKHLDPKFLDPKHAFRDVQAADSNRGLSTTNAHANLFFPEKKRRKRDGYDDGDYILFKRISASEFVKADNAIELLGGSNQIAFDSEEERQWLAYEHTTNEIVESCSDLKVLGKREFKILLKWRKILREHLGLEHASRRSPGNGEDVQSEKLFQDEETMLQREAQVMREEQVARKKREKRRANEKKSRLLQRMQLQMTTPMDIGLEQTDTALMLGQEDLFDLTTANTATSPGDHVMNAKELDDLGNYDSFSETRSIEELPDDTVGMDAQLDAMYSDFKTRRAARDAKFCVQEGRKQNKLREEPWTGITEKQGSECDSEEVSDEGGWDIIDAAKAKMNEDDVDSDSDANSLCSQTSQTSSRQPANLQTTVAAKQWFSQDIFADVSQEDHFSTEQLSHGVEAATNTDALSDASEVVTQEDLLWDENDENEGQVKRDKFKDLDLSTAEAVTIAQALVNRQSTKTKLINDGFNRHTFRDQFDLPSWFLDDEAKHYKPNLPVTKEAVAALRARQRALNARPIKKIAEAKARKKMRAAQRFVKAMKKAEGINESTDLSERDKATQIQKLMAMGTKHSSVKKNKPKVKVVVAKGAHKGVKGRPKGVKGKYLMVDARMRKEERAKKRIIRQHKVRK